MSFLGFSKQLLFIFPLFLRSFCQNALINKAQMEILIDDFNLTSHSWQKNAEQEVQNINFINAAMGQDPTISNILCISTHRAGRPLHRFQVLMLR